MKLINKYIDVIKFSVVGFLVVLGVVYGDIGILLFYVMKLFINGNGGLEYVFDDFIFGLLFLVFWIIIFLIIVKYVFIILKVDNNGEGGIFLFFMLVCN